VSPGASGSAPPSAIRAPDLVDRQFGVEAPNVLFVADFTYVPMATGGHTYTAFVIDAYAGLIVGWECSTSKETTFVERAIRQAGATRSRAGNPLQGRTIHHLDAGSPSLPWSVCMTTPASGARHFPRPGGWSAYGDVSATTADRAPA
jgi:putative transposase